MSIRITHRKDWNDHQNFSCMACNKMADLKIEARVGSTRMDAREYGPAQTLRLCHNHADITYGLLQDEGRANPGRGG